MFCKSKCAQRIAIFLSLLNGLPLMSQVTGKLSGTVVDPDGKPVAAARVILYLASTTIEDSVTTTDSRGSFLFVSLRPTYFDLAVEAPNFKKSEQKGVKVDPLTETPLPAMKLELGETRDVVETQASPNVLQTSTGQVSAVLSNEQVARLPLALRDPLALLDTLPGVTSNGRARDRTINGQIPLFSNITYDGINIQTSFLRANALGRTSNFLRTDQLSEATIVTANPAAPYAGGSIQVAFSPPSGSSQLHGTAYLNYINPSLSAQTFEANRTYRPKSVSVSQVGGSLSGPLVRNKLFYFLNYEGFFDRTTQQRLANVPVRALTSSGPTFQKVLALYPAPNAFLNTSFGTANFRNDQHEHATINGGIGRLDYLRSAQNTFSLTITTAKGRLDLPFESSPYQVQPNSIQTTNSYFYAGTWRSASKNGRLINEARVGGNLPSVDFQNLLRRDYRFILHIDFPGLSQPMLGQDPQGRDDYLYNYQDTLSYMARRHSLQGGMSLQQYRLNSYGIGIDNLTSFSVPYYYSGFCADGFTTNCANALNAGAINFVEQYFTISSPTSGYRAGLPPRSKPSMNLWSGFFQDNWRVNSHLTVNLGLRFDYQTPVTERTGSAIIPVLQDGAFMNLYNANLPFTFAGSGTSSSLYRSDKNNLSPNLGFAWSPFPARQIVLRGAYNLSYVNDDHLRHMGAFALENGFQPMRYYSFQQQGLPLEAFPFFNPPVLPSTLTLPALRRFSGLAVRAVNPNLSTPYVQQWNLAVEANRFQTIWSIRYVGNHFLKGLRSIDVDPDRVNQTARSAIWLLSNLGHSTYHALQIQASRRARGGLAFDVNYTFSKALSNLDDYTQGQLDPHLDIRNPGLNRAPAPFDLRHVFKSTWVYDLPSPRGRSKVLLGNWSSAGIIIAQSGAPLSILSGFRNSDGAGVGAVTTLTRDQIVPYLGIRKDGNGAFFVNAPAGTFTFADADKPVGALQRRMFNGPGAFTSNFSLRKLFTIAEGKSIEFRTEVFNIINRANWVVSDVALVDGPFFGRLIEFPGAAPDRLGTGSGQVGVLSGSRGQGGQQINQPRRIQFQLRVNF
jgi:hypothetical protein